MADLFGRLVDRTRGRGRLVRPAWTPAFAPAAGAGAVGEDGLGALERSTVVATTAAEPDGPSGERRRPSAPATAAPQRREERRPQLSPLESPPRPPVTPVDPGPSPTPGPAPRPRAVSEPAPPRAAAASGAVETAASSGRHRAAARPRSPVSSRPSPPPRESLALRPAPLADRQVRPSQGLADAAATPPAPRPPAIQVTIGRIEVRGVAPAVPPLPRAPRPKRQPLLSLEAYSAERQEGRR